MNKKIFPLFSLLLMFALAFTSFVPASAAALDALPGKIDGIRPPGYMPSVNLQLVYNAAANKIVLTAAFDDKSLIKRGDVSVRGERDSIARPWAKTATFANTKQIRLSYALPRGSTGVYCATVTLNGGKLLGTLPPRMIQGTETKCVVVPAKKITAQ